VGDTIALGEGRLRDLKLPETDENSRDLSETTLKVSERKQTTNSTREEFLFIFDVCFCLSLRRKVCRAFFDDVSDAESSKVMLNSKAFEQRFNSYGNCFRDCRKGIFFFD
jgi:hypothetical protein